MKLSLKKSHKQDMYKFARAITKKPKRTIKEVAEKPMTKMQKMLKARRTDR